jgi:hypothetical protein
VTLKWVTATETNNSHFEVERSFDGQRFDFIGDQQGFGNSTVEQYYSMPDNNTIAGVTYYRLKQVDYDGTYEYSDIVSINVPSNNSIASVVPNPIENSAIVRFGGELPTNSNLEIYLPTGQLVRTYQVTDTSIEINLKGMDKGVYFLRITNGYFNLSPFTKIIKL